MRTINPLALVIASGIMFVTTASLRASETDDRIESAAKDSHVFKTYLKDDSIKTEAENGAVTLTGSVAQKSHKSLAQDTVEGLPGVTSVDNQLTVSENAPVEQSDTWIGLMVKNALLFHRNVSSIKTDVNVADGVVSLSGEATSQAQKDLTAEYAKDVEGVKEVKNDMTVAKTPEVPNQTKDETKTSKIDDASITAQIKWSLMSQRSTSSLKTKVATTDGVVTVSGIAKNAAEKSLVTKLVTDIDGVTSVVNNMTIGEPVASN